MKNANSPLLSQQLAAREVFVQSELEMQRLFYCNPGNSFDIEVLLSSSHLVRRMSKAQGFVYLLPSCGLLSCHTFVLLQTPLFALAANNNNSEWTCRQDVNVNARIQMQTCVNTRSLMRRQANTLTHSLTLWNTCATQATAHNLWPERRFNLTTFDIDDDIH